MLNYENQTILSIGGGGGVWGGAAGQKMERLETGPVLQRFHGAVAGYTIQHPAFQRPLRTNLQPMHTDIRHFEQHPGFDTVRRTILR